MGFDLPDWVKRQDPLIWNQAWLVAMTAAGQIDYSNVLVIYAVDIEIALLISLLFYSYSFRLVCSRLLDWFVTTFMTAFLTLIVWALFHGTTDSRVDVSLGSLSGVAITGAVYYCMQMGLALRAARADKDPKFVFFTMIIYPSMMPLLFVIFVSLFVGQLAYGLVGGTASVSTHRLVATLLMAFSALLRVAFSRLLADPSQAGLEYSYFMKWSEPPRRSR